MAARGEPPYGQPMNLRSLCTLSQVVAQFRVFPKTGLFSVKDLKEKKYPLKVSVGVRNSNPETGVREILNAYGITYENIESWGGKMYYRPMSEGTSLMVDGVAEALFYISGMPDPSLTEISRSREVRILPISEPEVLKALAAVGFQKSAIPAAMYHFVKEDIPTVETAEILLCPADLPEELVYRVTKTIATNEDFLNSIQQAFAAITQKMMSGSGKFIPLHPGAEKFYREKGLF
jgi:uncharacterized protein